MAHDHAHDHGPAVIENTGKAFYLSIGLNVVYVLAEVIAGLAYNSIALLTDAGHNISDIGSLLLSLLAFRLAKKKPNKRYTYGYKKTTILAALANACILLIAIGVLGFETIQRFRHPEPVQGNVIAWVAGIGIVVNSLSAFLFYRNREKDLNIKSAYLHLLADALVSFGVVVAGIVISFTGWYILDPLIGVVVLVVILVSTWRLLTDSFQLAVDAVPRGIDLEEIRHVMAKAPHVKRVEHIHIWAISTTENSLTAHLELEEGLSLKERAAVINNIRHELQHHSISHCTIEIDTQAGEGCC